MACCGLNTFTSKSVEADTTRPCYASHVRAAPAELVTTLFTQSEWPTNSCSSCGARMSFEMSYTYSLRAPMFRTRTQLLSLAMAIKGTFGFIAVHITESFYSSRCTAESTMKKGKEQISVSFSTTCSISASVTPFSNSSRLAYPSHPHYLNHQGQIAIHLLLTGHGAQLVDVHGAIEGGGHEELVVVDAAQAGHVALVRRTTLHAMPRAYARLFWSLISRMALCFL